MFKLSYSYENSFRNNSRFESIDILRGIVMALMALDHCRDFFHVYAFDYAPEDLRYTTPIVFYTRWITHFCAPVFIFLTGVSAFLYKEKNKVTNKELAKYLLVRGIILILLEITVVRFAWRFYIDYSSIGGLVLWAIGWSMIALAGIIYLPRKFILFTSIFIIATHNLLDPINPTKYKFVELIWAFFHKSTFVNLSDEFGVNILYPVLPMIGLIAFGYYIGKWFTHEYSSEIRSGFLFYTGLIVVFLFLGIRVIQLVTEQYSYLFYLEPSDLNSKWTMFFKKIMGYLIENYGDPSPWQLQENTNYTIISFFNTTKYPMSFLYILMTMGPALIFLSLLENARSMPARILKVFGQVPLFYYVLHLFLIHTLAILLAILRNLDKIKEILDGDWKALSENYGFSMPVVYLIWLLVLVLLYPACILYHKLKSGGKYKFLSYL
jgi:uncharacterized membrane protein